MYPHRSFISFKATLFIKIFSAFSICQKEIGSFEFFPEHFHHLFAYSLALIFRANDHIKNIRVIAIIRYSSCKTDKFFTVVSSDIIGVLKCLNDILFALSPFNAFKHFDQFFCCNRIVYFKSDPVFFNHLSATPLLLLYSQIS